MKNRLLPFAAAWLAAALLVAPLSSVRAQSGGPPESRPGLPTITYASESESGFSQQAPEWVLQALQAEERSFAAGEQQAAGAGFVVSYIPAGGNDGFYSCVDFPQPARAALEYAAGIWSTLLRPRVPVSISACWAAGMPAGVLGSSGASNWFSDAALPLPAYYPSALANTLLGTDLDGPAPDIEISISNTFAGNFEYSLSGPGQANRFNFATLALHEIAHGLGFSGSLRLQNSGLVGRSDPDTRPLIYETLTTDSAGTYLYTYPGFPQPSLPLTQALTSPVFFTGANAVAANGGRRVAIYSPAFFQNGSSYVHLGEEYNGTPHALMTYSLGYREVNLDPGAVTLGILADIGWGVTAPKLALDKAVVAENQPAGTLVGSLSLSGAATTGPVSYRLPAGKGNNDQFAVQDGKLVTAAVLDFEAGPTRAVVVAASDESGPLGEQALTIQVSDANDPVTGLGLSRSVVQQNWPAGKFVAALRAVDQDSLDTHSFNLLPAASDDPDAVVYPDNAYFRIADGALVLQQPLPAEVAVGETLTLGVRVEDQGGTRFEGPLELAVVALVPEQVYIPMALRPQL